MSTCGRFETNEFYGKISWGQVDRLSAFRRVGNYTVYEDMAFLLSDLRILSLQQQC